MRRLRRAGLCLTRLPAKLESLGGAVARVERSVTRERPRGLRRPTRIPLGIMRATKLRVPAAATPWSDRPGERPRAGCAYRDGWELRTPPRSARTPPPR